MKRITASLLLLAMLLSLCLVPANAETGLEEQEIAEEEVVDESEDGDIDVAPETVVVTPSSTAGSGELNESDAPVASPISVSAYAAILIDMDSGDILFQYDIDEHNYPASTTKTMTAYLCCKYGNPEDTVTVSSSAFSDISERASTGGLIVGEKMTVHRLLQALLVVSASEAANVVGEYISGTHEEFVDLMNKEAAELGCTETHFANCHGLPNSDHYTSARDLAIIARAAMQYQEFRDIVGSATTVMEATNYHSATTITSTNGILPGSSYPAYNYPYAIGIKTGHTSSAGYCLISAADNGEHTLLCVVMGCGSRTGSFQQTIDLYEWGYENYDILTYNGGLENVMDKYNAEQAAQQAAEEAAAEAVAAETADSEVEALTAEPEQPSPTPAVSEAPASEAAAFSAESSAAEAASAEESLVSEAAEQYSGSTLIYLIIAGAAGILILILIIVLLVRFRRTNARLAEDDGADDDDESEAAESGETDDRTEPFKQDVLIFSDEESEPPDEAPEEN